MNLALPEVVELAATLDQQAIECERLGERIRRERRAAWLALQEAGMRYEDLHRLTGYGTTTIHTELRRARTERNGNH